MRTLVLAESDRTGRMTAMAVCEKESLAFLYERGRDRRRAFTPEEMRLLRQARRALDSAESVVLRLGGKAGRLGECIVATALLEGCLQALAYAGKVGTPVTILVDEEAGELFHALAYQGAYWPAIETIQIPTGDRVEAQDLATYALSGAKALLVDLHGAHDDTPYLLERDGHTALMHLYRAGIRYYARHGPLQRYRDFVTDLWQLEPEAIDPRLAQPIIRLGPWDDTRYAALAEVVGWQDDALHHDALHIVGFFQSVVLAKCYPHWDRVLQELAALVAGWWPNKQISFLIASGPQEQQLPGLHSEELAAAFASVSAAMPNAQVQVERIPSLRDLAMLVSRAALVLANDTGPGHLAGALGIPTITPFLPGGVYSKEVWASSLWHHGVTVEPNPFTSQQIESAVIWGDASIIGYVDPSRLAAEAFEALGR